MFKYAYSTFFFWIHLQFDFIINVQHSQSCPWIICFNVLCYIFYFSFLVTVLGRANVYSRTFTSFLLILSGYYIFSIEFPSCKNLIEKSAEMWKRLFIKILCSFSRRILLFQQHLLKMILTMTQSPQGMIYYLFIYVFELF